MGERVENLNIYVSFLFLKRVYEHGKILSANKLIKILYKASHMLLQLLTTIYFFIMTPEAERFNGWAAMLGFVAAVGAYVTTGQIIPGWF